MLHLLCFVIISFPLLALGLVCSFQIFKVETWITSLRPFLFSNVIPHWYTHPSEHCFSCIPQVLTPTFIQFQVFSNYPWDFFDHGIWAMCCLISKYLNIFQIFSCYWFPVWFHCGQRTYFVWFQFFYFWY